MPHQKALLGKISRKLIRVIEIPRLPRKIISGFAQLIDLTATVSDAMDNLGLFGAIPACVLPPLLPGKRIVGQALTMRNVETQHSVFRSAREGIKRMGGTEVINLSKAGDVIVIEGIFGVSNMGGQSATMAHRAGCAGAIIDGSFRDPESPREVGFPIWSKGVTQITGKWRLETVEINGRVRIAGVSANAGDLVTADDAGVVFIPHEHAATVLKECLKIDAGDKVRKQDIANGMDIAMIEQKQYRSDIKNPASRKR